jgi:PAS domain S-box-containing protein
VLLKRVLNQAQIPAEICPDLAALCEAVKAGAGAALVADEALTTDGLRQLAECVQEQEPWSDLPVFVMTHGIEEGRAHLKKLAPLGNVTILERPLRGETLVSAFRMGLRARVHQYQLRTKLEAEQAAVQALRDSEQRYRKLAESLPQLVWTANPDGDCDYLSRQWVEYTGVNEADQLRYGWLSQIHPDDQARAEAYWREAYRSGKQYDVEYRLRRSDGEYRWFKTRGVPVRDSSGAVQRWFGSCTDIEEQKQISEERRQLLAREQKARGLAELLNRVGPMLLEELDPDRLAQKVTDLATQLTGAQFGAMFYGDRYALSGVTREQFEKLGLPEARMLTTGINKTLVCGDISEDVPCLPVKTVRSYLAAPLMSRSGEVLGSLIFGSSEIGLFQHLHVKLAEGIAAQAAIALDNARLFAEAETARETLQHSNEELRRANDDLNQFAYSASHDLQEPLRMVALYSQMMERKYKALMDKTGSEYLGYMVQGARRMEMLLRDLLDYTQVISGNDEDIEGVDAKVVLGRAVQNLQRAVDESGAIVEGEGLPVLAVKEVHLLQLLQNLIGNALKYRGSEPPHVELSAQPDGRMWLLSVRDNGIGIAAAYTKQIFGLFKRLHGNSQYAGTGIGLAICQKIVERYGGRIWVESEGEGRGSTFMFTLPGVA